MLMSVTRHVRTTSASAAFAMAVALASAPAFAADDDDNEDVAMVIVPAPMPGGHGAATTANASTPLGTVLAAIRAQQWASARTLIDGMRDRNLAAFARAELYLAANSPRVEASDLVALVTEAPTLPQAPQLMRLAERRGATALPSTPSTQRLAWAGSTSRRGNPRSVNDGTLGDLPRTAQARITADDPAGAEALLTAAQPRLSPAALTEWQSRVAWSYYIENDDTNARRVAALAQVGSGDWVAQADWTQGLASWRQNDCRGAMAAFRNVAGRSNDSELTSAGHYWFARAATACAQPREAEAAFRRAAALGETFYGQLANETLGIRPATAPARANDADLRRLASRTPNIRAAVALAAAGEAGLAEETLRYQARIGSASDHNALVRVAAQLSLPETQLFLAHNTPGGVAPEGIARFPAPQWTPSGGWRVNPALVFAHALQESQFRTRAVSPAGAVGLMQVRPGTAGDMGIAAAGPGGGVGSLMNPAVNMAMGQNYIEHLRDSSATGGLLPKVIAAYNAGPTPVARWNSEIRDNGDPLLYIESIPYWETRAYVGIVLRNLWVYEREMGTPSNSRSMLAQGQWPRVPEAPVTDARRVATAR
jgi:soluble lytic murein transglycosylase